MSSGGKAGQSLGSASKTDSDVSMPTRDSRLKWMTQNKRPEQHRGRCAFAFDAPDVAATNPIVVRPFCSFVLDNRFKA